MAATLADLDPRDLTRLRAELCEVIAARFAYPAFYDYRAGTARVRPISTARRQEILTFVQTAPLDPIMPLDLASTETCRFLQSLFLRYLESNVELARGLDPRRRAAMRAAAGRAAAEVQRGLLSLAAGSPGGFGTARPPASWAPKADRGKPAELDWKRVERGTQQLAAALARSGPAPARSPSTFAASAPGRSAGGSGAWADAPLDHTAPLPSLRPAGAPPSASPFAGLAVGSQSSLFGEHAQAGMSDHPTGPQPIVGLGSVPPVAAPRELPPDLFQLYSQYMQDLNLSQSADAPPPQPRPMPAASAPSPAGAPPAPAPWADPTASPHYPRPPADPRSDTLIFDQLRHQVDAYIRLAARSYGVRVHGSDPASALDALRTSGNVDDADLRVAEGLLAIADRVCATGTASIEDYRQALMLYLLYHRARVGA